LQLQRRKQIPATFSVIVQFSKTICHSTAFPVSHVSGYSPLILHYTTVTKEKPDNAQRFHTELRPPLLSKNYNKLGSIL